MTLSQIYVAGLSLLALLPATVAVLSTISPSKSITGGPYFFQATSGNKECIRYITGSSGSLCLHSYTDKTLACDAALFSERCGHEDETFLGNADNLEGSTGTYSGMTCTTGAKTTQLTVYEESDFTTMKAEIPGGGGLDYQRADLCTWSLYLKFPEGDSDQTFSPTSSPTTNAPTTSPTTNVPTSSPTTSSPTTAPTSLSLQEEYEAMPVGTRPSQIGHGQFTWETLCNAVGDSTEGCPSWGKYAWCDPSFAFFDAPKADPDCTVSGIMVEDGRCYTCQA